MSSRARRGSRCCRCARPAAWSAGRRRAGGPRRGSAQGRTVSARVAGSYPWRRPGTWSWSAAARPVRRRRWRQAAPAGRRVLLLDRRGLPPGQGVRRRDRRARTGRAGRARRAGPHRRLQADDQALGGLARRRHRRRRPWPGPTTSCRARCSTRGWSTRPGAAGSRCAGTGSGRSQHGGTVVVDGIRARAVVAADGADRPCAGCWGRRRAERHTAIAVRGYATCRRQRAGRRRPVHRDAEARLARLRVVVPDRRRHREHRLRPDAAAAAGGRPPGKEVLHGRLAALLPDLSGRDLLAHHLPLSTGRPATPAAAGCCSPATRPA